MPFNSLEFIIFFALVFGLYFILPLRLIVLLLASYVFYMTAQVEYLPLLIGSTLFNYVLGLRLAREERLTYRRVLLGLSIGVNLGVLLVFKYLGADLLPLGISFYTLQLLSYSFDIYQGKTQPTQQLGIFALFVAFFPQITAGPIARADTLITQFANPVTFDYERVVSGLQRMAWGFFKKLVIADRLAIIVNMVYNDPTQFTGLPLILTTYMFAFQIYCDFSAYSDIAIGAARILGFKLEENFKQPYFATSIVEFWRRWHISLSSWLRDYIFFPFSRGMLRRYGSQRGLLIQSAAYTLTMLASGLWHGTNWTFVVWGALHALFIVVTVVWQRLTKPIKWPLRLPPLVARSIKVFATFNLVAFTWIFFRANSLADATYIATHLFTDLQFTTILNSMMPGGGYEFIIAIAAIIVMQAVEAMHVAKRYPTGLRWSLYYLLILAILLFGQFGQSEFIYAQF